MLLCGWAILVSAQWNQGSSIISTTNNVGINTSSPSGKLQVVGDGGWDSSTRFYLTNGATNYGRTNLILTGRIQDSNDGWYFGSNARNSIVFSSNASAAWQNPGSVGTEQYSIQHQMLNNALGFMSATRGSSPILSMNQDGLVGVNNNAPAARLHVNSGSFSILAGEMCCVRLFEVPMHSSLSLHLQERYFTSLFFALLRALSG